MKLVKKFSIILILIGTLLFFYKKSQFGKIHYVKSKSFNIIKLNITNIKLGHRLPNALIIGTIQSGAKSLLGNFKVFYYLSKLLALL